jgi:hypothetical protein
VGTGEIKCGGYLEIKYGGTGEIKCCGYWGNKMWWVLGK